MAPTEIEIWFRVEDVLRENTWNEYGPPSVHVVTREYPVAKVTPCGVRLACGRFVLRVARKRYACPTREEAMQSFLARKKRQASILRSRLGFVEEAIRQAEEAPF